MDMPCGFCSYCEEVVDFAKAGVCKICGEAFHWPSCGEWNNGEHACYRCAPYEEQKD